MPLPEYCLVSDFTQSGGGYGDPLDRDPEAVARDVRVGYATHRAAERVYGVALDAQGGVDEAATAALRARIRAERVRGGAGVTAEERTAGDEGDGAPPSLSPSPTGRGGEGEALLRFHEYLEVARLEGALVIRCRGCGHRFCGAEENYKRHAVETREDLEALAGGRVPSGEAYVGEYRSYACPGCGTLLQVDVYCPSVGGETPLWDIQLDVQALQAR
jgi:hypothetical protein